VTYCDQCGREIKGKKFKCPECDQEFCEKCEDESSGECPYCIPPGLYEVTD
jgi:hypothetical protein